MVVLVKFATAPTAIVTFAAIAALSWRRAWWTLAAAIPIGAGLFGLSVLIEPREWRCCSNSPT
ncbi:hypothetical protein V5P93_007044 [Actinokineospora auranticolor]|uniref:hypothetical protein n=1 Tax=Actinokineospora auranticolor TaxID=155976 RepID=UPI000CEBD5AA|nr:hypothetical protein [Actinokineospora auranticolor]